MGEYVSDVVEWEWRVGDPDDYSSMDAQEILIAYALGEPVRLLALALTGAEPGNEADDHLAAQLGVENPFGVRVGSDGMAWIHCAVYTIEREGVPGLEILEEFLTREDAIAAVEADQSALIEMVSKSNE